MQKFVSFGTRTEIKSCQESYDILKYQNKIQIFPLCALPNRETLPYSQNVKF